MSFHVRLPTAVFLLTIPVRIKFDGFGPRRRNTTGIHIRLLRPVCLNNPRNASRHPSPISREDLFPASSSSAPQSTTALQTYAHENNWGHELPLDNIARDKRKAVLRAPARAKTTNVQIEKKVLAACFRWRCGSADRMRSDTAPNLPSRLAHLAPAGILPPTVGCTIRSEAKGDGLTFQEDISTKVVTKYNQRVSIRPHDQYISRFSRHQKKKKKNLRHPPGTCSPRAHIPDRRLQPPKPCLCPRHRHRRLPRPQRWGWPFLMSIRRRLLPPSCWLRPA